MNEAIKVYSMSHANEKFLSYAWLKWKIDSECSLASWYCVGIEIRRSKCNCWHTQASPFLFGLVRAEMVCSMCIVWWRSASMMFAVSILTSSIHSMCLETPLLSPRQNITIYGVNFAMSFMVLYWIVDSNRICCACDQRNRFKMTNFTAICEVDIAMTCYYFRSN